jgi:hypothetical protein
MENNMYFGDDRKLLDSATAIIKETVAQLPISEQSEYNKRLRTYQFCFAQKNKLIKDKNWLYEEFQKNKKESNKSKLITLVAVLAYMIANWLLAFDSDNKFQFFGIFVVGYFGYMHVIEKINECEYVQKMKLYEFEIKRYEIEIEKIGVFTSVHRHNDMQDVDTYSEEIKNKMLFENECYFINYCIEILQAMCVPVDVDKEARLRME